MIKTSETNQSVFGNVWVQVLRVLVSLQKALCPQIPCSLGCPVLCHSLDIYPLMLYIPGRNPTPLAALWEYVRMLDAEVDAFHVHLKTTNSSQELWRIGKDFLESIQNNKDFPKYL